MANQETHNLYNNSIEITFFPDSHRYKLKGEKTYLNSVTSITGIIDKSRILILWAIGLAGSHLRKYFEESKSNTFSPEELIPVINEALNQHNVKREEAADIGTQVHDLALQISEALRDNKELPLLENLDERVANGISAFINWLTGNKVEFIECERLVYSKKYNFVGITDAIILMNGKRYLIDYKTSKSGHYSEYKYQVAAYCLAYEEETGEKLDGTAIVHFNKETGDFEHIEISNEDNIINQEVFLACLKIKEREKELAKK
jgi:hypothetical protein